MQYIGLVDALGIGLPGMRQAWRHKYHLFCDEIIDCISGVANSLALDTQTDFIIVVIVPIEIETVELEVQRPNRALVVKHAFLNRLHNKIIHFNWSIAKKQVDVDRKV